MFYYMEVKFRATVRDVAGVVVDVPLLSEGLVAFVLAFLHPAGSEWNFTASDSLTRIRPTEIVDHSLMSCKTICTF